MARRTKFSLLTLSVFALLVLAGPISGQKFTGGVTLSLDSALKSAAGYCERLESASLNYVCLEEIKEKEWIPGKDASALPGGGAFPSTFYTQNTYVYDYQLIRKQGQIFETRTLIEENGQKRHERDAPLKTEVFQHHYVIFGPIGFVGSRWQTKHDYKIVKEEIIKNERCVVVEALPKDTKETGHLFGKLWLRIPDAAILKIEWNQASMGNIEAIKSFARRANLRPEIAFSSEYAVEKNGIRFPSRYFVKEDYIDQTRMQRINKSETLVTYENYKYFTVETNIRY